ncbi:hypothetical protein Q5741_09435 [Paenibacillus sp. JX-17]|uniref:ABC transporter permease n=1 Tax=Paenibacillus lacisoli TaxID=3064525 RepID=A0ABT9CFC6_9BACL|nr:hypothetical protein [Paenibacillus sp. JX-17]MDO7906642.1 hypothetical protein [Paenibacillus sp. JX-17]
MSTFKQAWLITRREVSIDRLLFLWSLLFMIYTGGVIGSLIRSAVQQPEWLSLMVDFMMMAFVPFTAFFFSRRSFKYLQEDSYTQMLAYMRILPIPVKAVIVSRVQQLLIAVVLNGIVFYGIMYVAVFTGNPSVHTDVISYLGFVLTWVGYTMIVNGLYIYLEFLNHGKKYFWTSLVVMAFALVAAAAAKWMDVNVLKWTMSVSRDWGLASPLMWVSLLAGALILRIMCGVTLKKLNRRSLL